MKIILVLVACVFSAVGCDRDSSRNTAANGDSAEHRDRSAGDLDAKGLRPRITNRFGMTFRLVTIDKSRADHEESFPEQSYYLQETRLTGEQHAAFRTAAFGDGKYESIDWNSSGGHPSEWREWHQYAEALSSFDSDYDYRLPSRSQWKFACMSGYEQSCNVDEPNANGFVGMLNSGRGFAEPVDELFVRDGHKFGVCMGYWKNNWHEHDGESKPICPCDYWTACNPDADDSLNEIIEGRFVLIPRQTTNEGL